MLNHFLFVVVKLKCVNDELVALNHLARRKTDRDFRRFGVVFNEVHYAVQASVHRAAVLRLVAEVRALRLFLIGCNVYRVVYKLVNTLVFRRGDWHYRNAQKFLHSVDVNLAAVALDFVHHVEREHHWRLKLHELHCEVEVALYIGCIDYVDDALWFVFNDVFARHNFFVAVRGEGVYAGQVHNLRVLVAFNLAALSVNRDAGEVANVLI